jgi:hypothetical protein
VTEVEFVETSLSDAVKVIGEELGVDVYLDDASLMEYEVSPDTPVTLKAKGPFREILRRLLMKIDSDAEVDYVVRDSGIEITTREEINSEPATRYYDLSFVLPNSNNADSLIIAIQNQIEPDAWVQAGGQFPMSLVGSMLIVGCSESAHFQIQNMLSRLAAMNRMNLEKSAPSMPMQYHPGMGGGMGGMGGGMGGMGGGGMGGMGGGMF